MKFTFLFLATTLIISSNAYSQDYEKVQLAFKTSYTNETNGDYSKGVEELKKVYNEDSYEINLRLGWLTYLSGLFTESQAYYNKAITLMPYSIEARLGIVLPASSMGNWNIVIKAYDKILELDPSNSTANYRLGMIYYGKKDYEKSLKYFEKNVNHYPFTYDSLIMYAWCNYFVGKLREAKVLFNKVIMLSPDNASAIEGLALIK